MSEQQVIDDSVWSVRCGDVASTLLSIIVTASEHVKVMDGPTTGVKPTAYGIVFFIKTCYNTPNPPKKKQPEKIR